MIQALGDRCQGLPERQVTVAIGGEADSDPGASEYIRELVGAVEGVDRYCCRPDLGARELQEHELWPVGCIDRDRVASANIRVQERSSCPLDKPTQLAVRQ